MTAELNIRLKVPVSPKTLRRGLHMSNIHGKAAIAKPLITSSNAQMRKRFRQQYYGTVFCWTHFYPSWPNDCKGVRGQLG
jgi:hypothetical protein